MKKKNEGKKTTKSKKGTEMSLISKQPALVLDSLLSEQKVEPQEVLQETKRRIEEGKKKETASTGTPMKNIPGNAYNVTRLSNIGGGSLQTGGGGMMEGLAILLLNEKAKTKVNEDSKKEIEPPK